MAGPFLSRDHELWVQLESAFGTSPGALAGTDAVKHLQGAMIERVLARYDRNKDRDNAQASVITTLKGRESSKWAGAFDLIPSNNASTVTVPDIDPFLEAHFGTKHAATAHTTTTAGSAGTSLVLVGGGGAASGITAGDIIAVDVSTAAGYEARRVVSITVDTVVVDRAFTTDPATGRTVKVGVTYKLSEAQKKSLSLWEFLNGNNFRYSAGGCLVQNLNLDIDFSSQTPVAGIKFDGVGAQKIVAATSRPTPTTIGVPLIPTEGKVWIGATRAYVVKYGLKSNNGLELRANDSTSLYPSGVKRTANEGRYQIEQSIDVLLQTGTIEGYHTNEKDLTAYDVIAQLGVTPGQIVVISTPKFIPSVPVSDTDGEISLSMSGRAYGTVGDDEVFIAFL